MKNKKPAVSELNNLSSSDYVKLKFGSTVHIDFPLLHYHPSCGMFCKMYLNYSFL
jgi:hypothetical protein